MNDKAELNYVLSGYFANVMITLLEKYPSQILKYLYTTRKDAIRKIVFHSHQKAFSMLSLRLLNIENIYVLYKQTESSAKDKIFESIDFRNELVGEIIKSINLDGFINEKNEIQKGVDIEAKFALIYDLINENKKIIKYLVFNKDVYAHLFSVLDTDLYNIDNNDSIDNNLGNKYTIYGFFINLITKLLKNASTNYILNYPNEFDFNCIKKPKNEITFIENMILTFGRILKNNFLAKKPKLILESGSTIPYEGLGILNIKILELIKEMLIFMKELPKQFDSILIRNNFCQKSIDYFFQYQWNNIYHIQFVDLFNLFLSNEEKHKDLTDFLFNNIKLHELLINYLIQDKIDEKDIEKIIPKQKLKFNFKSGRSISCGVYPHVIDLIYKIQSIAGLEIFTEEEKKELNIKNYGEFEFSKDEKSNRMIKEIKISNNISNILKKSKDWNEATKDIVIPLIKKYEGQLCKEEKKSDDEIELNDDSGFKYLLNNSKRNSAGSTGYLLQQLLNVIKKEHNPKRASLPISRNDKNSKIKTEKSSIREKLLNKSGYRSRKIFEDEEDEDKNKEQNNNLKKDINIGDEKKENDDTEENNKYNDTNYWEVKNSLPEDLKKEVDKKTNIIFNYNPITYENNNKNEISEEDELLSIAMGLEQNEKIEKNKKIMYIVPGKLKPINLKAKTSPVQSIFSSSNEENKYNKLKNKIKDKINIFKEEKKKEYNTNDSKNTDNYISSNAENEENEEEEKAIIRKDEDKNEKIEKENEVDNTSNNIKEENDVDKIYNDVNYWGVNSSNYLNEKEMEDCLKDL